MATSNWLSLSLFASKAAPQTSEGYPAVLDEVCRRRFTAVRDNLHRRFAVSSQVAFAGKIDWHNDQSTDSSGYQILHQRERDFVG
jgi:hypothetical protein